MLKVDLGTVAAVKPHLHGLAVYTKSLSGEFDLAAHQVHYSEGELSSFGSGVGVGFGFHLGVHFVVVLLLHLVHVPVHFLVTLHHHLTIEFLLHGFLSHHLLGGPFSPFSLSCLIGGEVLSPLPGFVVHGEGGCGAELHDGFHHAFRLEDSHLSCGGTSGGAGSIDGVLVVEIVSVELECSCGHGDEGHNEHGGVTPEHDVGADSNSEHGEELGDHKDGGDSESTVHRDLVGDLPPVGLIGSISVRFSKKVVISIRFVSEEVEGDSSDVTGGDTEEGEVAHHHHGGLGLLLFTSLFLGLHGSIGGLLLFLFNGVGGLLLIGGGLGCGLNGCGLNGCGLNGCGLGCGSARGISGYEIAERHSYFF